MLKKIFIPLLVIAAIPAGGLILIGVLMILTEPREADIETSKVIYTNFVQAATTNLLANKRAHFEYSPRRGSTWIRADGIFSPSDQVVLKAIANRIESNENWQVEVIFSH